MFKAKRFFTLCFCSMILIGFVGCAAAPVRLNTTTGKPEIVINSSKEAAAEYITSVMLSWDYMIKNQTGNVLVFYKSITYPAPVFPIWDTTPRPGEYRITYNLVNVSEGVRVMVSIVGVKNPNTAYETQEEDRSKGTNDSVNVQNMLNDMKTRLASSIQNNNVGKVGIEVSKADGKTVSRLEENGPAEKAGLQAGDIIVSINGATATTDITENVSRICGEIGTTCQLVVYRNGASKTFSIVRQKKPESGWTSSPASTQAPSISADAAFNVQSIGATVSSGKVLSVVAAGPAEKAGIQKDDLITMIDGDAVSNNWMENVQKLMGKTNTSVVVSLKRGDMEMTVPVIRKNP
jgi:hypothetical protein